NTHALVRQKIWLDKDDYAPKQVQVSDAEAKVVVEVKFDKFDFGAKFDDKSFDMQHNLDTAGQRAKGTLLEVDENGMLVERTDASETGANAAESDGSAAPALNEPFGVIVPTYLPEGVVYKDDKVVDDSDRSSVLLRYDGTYQFTVTESRSPDRTVSLVAG